LAQNDVRQKYLDFPHFVPDYGQNRYFLSSPENPLEQSSYCFINNLRLLSEQLIQPIHPVRKNRRSMALHNSESTVIPFPPPTGFERKLRRLGALIECRCLRCGFRFIGSVSRKLAVVEQIHVCECTKKKLQRDGLSTCDSRRKLKTFKAHA
jgi:hypothetical protein